VFILLIKVMLHMFDDFSIISAGYHLYYNKEWHYFDQLTDLLLPNLRGTKQLGLPTLRCPVRVHTNSAGGGVGALSSTIGSNGRASATIGSEGIASAKGCECFHCGTATAALSSETDGATSSTVAGGNSSWHDCGGHRRGGTSCVPKDFSDSGGSCSVM
jgi:hypothetical protein